jgi:sialate O-acetylesterase
MNPKNNRRWRLVVCALMMCASAGLRAEVKLPAIFSDHAVLQKGSKVPVWGKAAPGEDVSVAIGGVTAKARTGGDGRWAVRLNLLQLGPGPFEMEIKGSKTLVIRDVLIGEVWLASGQSNMEWWLKNNRADKQEVADSENNQLRQFLVNQTMVPERADDVPGWWSVAGPKTSGGFTAVGYYFGKALQKELGVPVAIINASRGRTGIEGWISEEGLAHDDELSAAARRYKAERETPAEAQADVTVAKKPKDPEQIGGYLFNGMIAPLIPYAIRGVIWYQGETNAGRAWQYRTAFPLLIQDWRAQWGQGDFPFYFCQLANHGGKSHDHMESGWSEIREAQSKALELLNTGQAVLIDIGEAADVHPRNKRDVGDRLSRLALAQTYGRKVVYSGPVYAGMTVVGETVTLRFEHTEGGLVARSLPGSYKPSSVEEKEVPLMRNSPGSELEGFEICGEDRKWTWAEARIKGDEIEVWAQSVSEPVAVRYAWAMNPTCNLYNGAGLPASPFRTDTFPVSTVDVRY